MHMFTVSAPFVGPDANASRQRHAPLYGRLVAEEHLPAAHRDAVHQVSFAKTFILYVLVIASCFFSSRFFSLSFSSRSLFALVLCSEILERRNPCKRRRRQRRREEEQTQEKKKKEREKSVGRKKK